ncbi:MAG: hypothetical protein ABR500_14765 [Dermatophilaceae bacterium]
MEQALGQSAVDDAPEEAVAVDGSFFDDVGLDSDDEPEAEPDELGEAAGVVDEPEDRESLR